MLRAEANGLAEMNALQRGVAAIGQYRARESHLPVPRQHVETLYPAQPAQAARGGVVVKLGVWMSNVKSPARQAKLTGDQLTTLARLGLNRPGSNGDSI